MSKIRSYDMVSAYPYALVKLQTNSLYGKLGGRGIMSNKCQAFHIVAAHFSVDERCTLDAHHPEIPHRFESSDPTIVCLCGSTRFKDEFINANMEETLAGRIVLSVGAFMHADNLLLEAEKRTLDLLHLRKIDLATEVLFLNVGGYMGKSTTRELAYAVFTHKPLRWLEPLLGEEFMAINSHAIGQLVADFLGGDELPEMRAGHVIIQVSQEPKLYGAGSLANAMMKKAKGECDVCGADLSVGPCLCPNGSGI